MQRATRALAAVRDLDPRGGTSAAATPAGDARQELWLAACAALERRQVDRWARTWR